MRPYHALLIFLSICAQPIRALSTQDALLFAHATECYTSYKYQDAAHLYQQITQNNPHLMQAWYGYGLCCHNIGLFEQADKAFKYVFEHDHNKQACRSKLMLHALRTKQWERTHLYGLHPYWWYDSDIQNKTILITSANAGIGDIVQFLRYLKRLHAAGARVILEASSYLHPILSSCPFINNVVLPASNCVADMTLRVSTPELALTMRNTLDTPSSDIPYLYANPERINYWKEQLASVSSIKIGLCWQASQVIDAKTGELLANPRSIPLSCFSQLFELTQCSFYSLQVGSGCQEITEHAFSLHVFDKTFDRTHGAFVDTLAVMKQLDLVITADTSIAHIAGALGIPVWVILPVCSDFRWFLNSDTSPWYPTMKLFRQKTCGDWTDVMQEVYAHLKDYPNILSSRSS